MTRASTIAITLGVALGLAPVALRAASRSQDPDWPCLQPLVPTIAAATIWSGPPLEGIGDWHAKRSVAALVERIAPRAVPAADGEAAIREFARGLSGDRAHLVLLAFAGVLDETNRERREVIDRIKELAERQRNLADLIARLTTELDAIPADVTAERANERAELEQRRTFASRVFKQTQMTMRYACEVPAAIDARLGAYARAFQRALS